MEGVDARLADRIEEMFTQVIWVGESYRGRPKAPFSRQIDIFMGLSVLFPELGLSRFAPFKAIGGKANYFFLRFQFKKMTRKKQGVDLMHFPERYGLP